MGGKSQDVPTLAFQGTTHFKVKAFSSATHVICGMLSLLTSTKQFLVTLEPIVALLAMKASPIQRCIRVIMV
jgi:hypothetical protein